MQYIYISPNEIFTVRSLVNLIDQSPSPFIIMGDFNSRRSLWGDDIINQSRRIIEQLLIAENVNLMNEGSPTRFCVQTGNMTIP